MEDKYRKLSELLIWLYTHDGKYDSKLGWRKDFIKELCKSLEVDTYAEEENN